MDSDQAMRERGTAPCAVLAAFIAGTGLPRAAGPIAVSLAPISAEALHECKEADLKKALLEGLGPSKVFRYIPDLQEAPLKIEIVACTRLEQVKRTFNSSGRPIRIPIGTGVGFGGEGEVGVQSESTRWAILRARVGAGTRFLNVEADPKDRSLKIAAESIRREIEKAFTEHGEWLLEAAP